MITDVPKDLNSAQEEAIKKEEEVRKARQEWQQKEQVAQAQVAQATQASWSEPARPIWRLRTSDGRQEEEHIQA